MNKEFLFRIASMDAAVCLPQVRDALEKYTELNSREKYPRLWRLVDRLRAMSTVSDAQKARRRVFRIVLGTVCWGLGVFGLLPALMSPEELGEVLALGALVFAGAVGMLWHNQRTLLVVLSLSLGSLLTWGAWVNQTELGVFLWFGLVNLAVGGAAVWTRIHKKKDPFRNAAEVMVQARQAIDPETHTQITFSEREMIVWVNGATAQVVPYTSFTHVIETADLFLLVYADQVTVLQKTELQAGEMEDFRTCMRTYTPYTAM